MCTNNSRGSCYYWIISSCGFYRYKQLIHVAVYSPFPFSRPRTIFLQLRAIKPFSTMGAFNLVLPCVARYILLDETEPTIIKITDHSPAIFSQEGHHLITVLKLYVIEAILCVSKHSTPSLQPLHPPTVQTWGVFSPWRIEVHAWSEFIQPEEQQWLASKKWDYYG